MSVQDHFDFGLELRKAHADGYEAGRRDAVKWINGKERLPETDIYALVYGQSYGYEVCMYYGDGEWLTRDLSNVTRLVSHWMPLPEPPEEEA